jgi:Icc-related predicted phosphoesterase
LKLQIWSDAHTEFWDAGNPKQFSRLLEKYLPETEEDKETTLICAGDMGKFNTYSSTYKPLFALLSKRFKHVVVVPGNHSYYGSRGTWGNEKEYWVGKTLPTNVYYLDNAIKVIDGVAFIGSCLWTSFKDRDQLAMMHASRAMNDFHLIKKNSGETTVYGNPSTQFNLTPEDTVEKHYDSVSFIKQALEVYKEYKCVVVTHHMPSGRSVHERYVGDLLNHAFYTELSTLMLDHEPLLWVHGHTHDSCDYILGETRVVCNPLGYHAVQLNKKFNPHLIVEVN